MLINLLIILLALIVIYLILIMPKIINKPDLSKLMGRFYAHRGMHQARDIPENSLAAFRLALKNGYGIELDVQLSKDKVPVVFHDDDLKRVCGINKKVKDFTYDQLRRFTLFNSNERIPHLQEVLNLVDGRVPLIVEIKATKTFDRESLICSVVSLYLDKYKGVYCIESFNPLILLWYKKNRPNIVRGQLATYDAFKNIDIKSRFFNFSLRNLLFNLLTKPDFIAYDHKFSHIITYNICRILYRPLTIAYTIQTQRDLNRNLSKFDLFIFDKFIPE